MWWPLTQANVESLQTMLSDPESLAPSLPLEMSFSPDEASNSGQAAEASASAYPAANVGLGEETGPGYITAEVLGMSTQFLLSTQVLCMHSEQFCSQMPSMAPVMSSAQVKKAVWITDKVRALAGSA